MQQLKSALMTFILLTIITGVIYPLAVFGFGQLFVPYEANGSLIRQNGQIIGSELIGQSFTENKYLWGRPSVTADHPYNALSSGGSNLGPSNPDLLKAVTDRVNNLGANAMTPAPIDLVSSSGSGLDPEISIASAYFQIKRIAHARGMSEDKIEDIINQNAKYPLWGFIGEPRVNVLKVNLAMDGVK
jgi:K+-transporting ATPase ATPase C chain